MIQILCSKAVPATFWAYAGVSDQSTGFFSVFLLMLLCGVREMGLWSMGFNVKVRIQAFFYLCQHRYTHSTDMSHISHDFFQMRTEQAPTACASRIPDPLQQRREHHLAQEICLLGWQPARLNVYWIHSLSLLHLYR